MYRIILAANKRVQKMLGLGHLIVLNLDEFIYLMISYIQKWLKKKKVIFLLNCQYFNISEFEFKKLLENVWHEIFIEQNKL